MPISYPLIAREVAFRCGIVTDGDSGTRSLVYNTASISGLETFIDSVEVPPRMLRDSILMAEQKIAEYIGYSKDHPYRAELEAASSPLTTGSFIPTTSASGLFFIGAFSSVQDATSGLPYSEQPKRVVTRYIENPGGFWKIQPRYYCLAGGRIFHTGTSVVMRGCVWSRSVAESAYQADGNSVLPSVFEPVLVAMALSMITTEGWFKEEAAFYKSLADSMLESIEVGKAQRLSLPSLPTTASVAAAAD